MQQIRSLDLKGAACPIALAVVLLFSSGIAVSQSLEPGHWIGAYRCAPEVSQAPLELLIKETDGQFFEGELAFGDGTANALTARYMVTGRMMPDGSPHAARTDGLAIQIQPGAWIERPTNARELPVELVLEPDGRITGNARNCTRSEILLLQQGTDNDLEPAAPAATMTLRLPTRGAFEGEWRARLSCQGAADDTDLALTLLHDDDRLTGLLRFTHPSDRLSATEAGMSDYFAGYIDADGQFEADIARRLTGVLRGRITRASAVKGSNGDTLLFDIHFQNFARRCDTPIQFSRVGAVEQIRAPELDLLNQPFGNFDRQGEHWFQVFGDENRHYLRWEAGQPANAPRSQQSIMGVTLRPLTVMEDQVVLVPVVLENPWRREALPGLPLGNAEMMTLAMSDDGELTASLRRFRTSGRSPTELTLAPLDQGEAGTTRSPAMQLATLTTGTLAAAEHLVAQCETLLDWVTPALAPLAEFDPQGSSIQRRDILYARLLDSEFVPTFGVSFWLMSDQERSAVRALIGQCESREQLHALRSLNLAMLFGNPRSIQDRLALLHEHEAWIADEIEAVSNLPLGSDGETAIEAVRAEMLRRQRQHHLADSDALQAALDDHQIRITEERQQLAEEERRRAAEAALQEAADLHDWPAGMASLDRLNNLGERLLQADETDAELETALQAVRKLAEEILMPEIDRMQAEVDTADEGPASLIATRTAMREAEAIQRRVNPALQPAALRALVTSIRERRRDLLASEALQNGLLAEIESLQLGSGFPRAAAFTSLERYLDESELTSLQRNPEFRRELEAAIERLDVQSAALDDRSVEAVDGEPEVGAMLLAVRDQIDMATSQHRTSWERCQRGDLQDNPLFAVQCLSLLSAGGPPEVRITRFTKLGCVHPPETLGYLCDFAVNYRTSHDMLDSILADLPGDIVSQRRFVPTTSGWEMR